MNRSNPIIYAGKKLRLNKIAVLVKFVKDFIHYRGFVWGELLSIEGLSSGSTADITVLSLEKVRLYYSLPIFNDGSGKKAELLEGREYTRYVARIKNATIYGDSNLITLSSRNVLYDLPFYDENRRYQYTNYNSKIIHVGKNKVFGWKGIKHHLEKAVWMGGNFSWNYYHLLYEFVIKFLQLNTLNIPLDTPVLVDQRCLEVPQYKELLTIANVKGYRLIGVDRRDYFKVDELVYINCPNFIPPNNVNNEIFSDDIQFNVEELQKLRNHFLAYSSQKDFPKRIFISRKNASGRRSFNEEAVCQLLSEFGFVLVFTETLSVRDQISLFNGAEWIAGGSGAAFTNILFCGNLSKALIFSRGYFPFSGFSTIASMLGVRLLYLTEEDTNKNMVRGNIHDAFEMDLSYLREQLISLGL